MPRSRAASSQCLCQEPSVEDGIAILRGLRDKYELFHGVRITDGAIVAAVELSSRYISDRFLPDKAIDLIDEAASGLRIALENKPPLLEETDRKIRRLEIERRRSRKIWRVNTAKRLKSASKVIDKEVADFKEKTSELELKWKNGKEVLTGIRSNKTELEAFKIQARTKPKLQPILVPSRKFAMVRFHTCRKIWK